MRAFDPFPGATAMLGDDLLKCWRAVLASGDGVPGTVLAVDETGVTVACGAGALRLTELQRAGGKRLSAAQFLKGKALVAGSVFEPLRR